MLVINENIQNKTQVFERKWFHSVSRKGVNVPMLTYILHYSNHYE